MSLNKSSARWGDGKPWRGRPEPDFGWAARLEKQLKREWAKGHTKVNIDKQY